MQTKSGTGAENDDDSANAVDLRIKTEDAPTTGCCGLTSKNESNQL